MPAFFETNWLDRDRGCGGRGHDHCGPTQSHSPDQCGASAQFGQSEAAKAIPVRLRGVVIDPAAPIGAAVIIADESAGLYILGTTNQLSRYHRCRFFGSDRGDQSGAVRADCQSVRRAENRHCSDSPPRPVTYQELITGALDGQWVEVSGVVHRCLEPARTNDYWRIYLAVNGGMLSARVRSPRNLEFRTTPRCGSKPYAWANSTKNAS